MGRRRSVVAAFSVIGVLVLGTVGHVPASAALVCPTGFSLVSGSTTVCERLVTPNGFESWTIPAGVTSLDLLLVGGGGAGGNGSSAFIGGGGGGGGGGAVRQHNNVFVVPGETVQLEAGAGGANSNGGNTSFEYPAGTTRLAPGGMRGGDGADAGTAGVGGSSGQVGIGLVSLGGDGGTGNSSGSGALGGGGNTGRLASGTFDGIGTFGDAGGGGGGGSSSGGAINGGIGANDAGNGGRGGVASVMNGGNGTSPVGFGRGRGGGGGGAGGGLGASGGDGLIWIRTGLVESGAESDPDSGGGGNQTPINSQPAPILQQVTLPDSGTCDAVDDRQLMWGTGLTGGWVLSWAEWANGGQGGPVCTRMWVWREGNGWDPA